MVVKRGSKATDANDQQVLWNLDSDVLRGSCSASLPRALCEFEALIDIRTFEVIQGDLPDRAMALVLEWAREHRDELIKDWELCVQNQMPMKIRPLP